MENKETMEKLNALDIFLSDGINEAMRVFPDYKDFIITLTRENAYEKRETLLKQLYTKG